MNRKWSPATDHHAIDQGLFLSGACEAHFRFVANGVVHTQSKRQIIVTVIGVALAGTTAVIGVICAAENFQHDTTGDMKVWRLNIALLSTSIALGRPQIICKT